MDWVYKQIVGVLANFFAEMGNMGEELFEMSWVQSIHARYEKNRTLLCTQLISNSSAPMFPISAKKLARKPTICL